MNYREGKCYKCKGPIQYNIPVLSREFKAYKAVCECGYEQVTFTPRDPKRQKLLQEAIAKVRAELQESK